MSDLDAKSLISARLEDRKDSILSWFEKKSAENPPPFYSSIDIRDAEFKVAPVDCNLFPAGFNNICDKDLRAAPNLIHRVLEKFANKHALSKFSKVVIVPEKHTSNQFYIENLFYLEQLLKGSGLETRIGWYTDSTIESGPIELTSQSGKRLQAIPISIEAGKLQVGSFEPDFVVLNNDFSDGLPELLMELEQPIFPSPKMGWYRRRKVDFFLHYNRLAEEVAEILDFDPWMLTVETQAVDEIDFQSLEGIEKVSETANLILTRAKAEYKKRGIDRDPVVFVKNNVGTYGMGIMVIKDAAELKEMNRRTRNKMSIGKGRIPIHSVVVQEGIPTATLVNRLPAEPVIYLIGSQLIGGFLRTNEQRSDTENLNSKGMVFKTLCMSDLDKILSDENQTDAPSKNRFLEWVYGSIARLSAVAAGTELSKNL